MAGASIAVDTRDLTRLNERLAALARRGANLTPMLDEIGAALVASTLLRFENQVDPEGEPWAPLAESTKIGRLGGAKKAFTKKGALRKPAARKLAGLKILLATGRLRDSITHRASPTQVEVGSNVVYARIHQLGGKAGRGRQVTIPARPYLGIDASDEIEIGRIVDDYLSEALQ